MGATESSTEGDKKLKGLHATKKSWNMHSFKSGIVNSRGQYVVCGQYKTEERKT